MDIHRANSVKIPGTFADADFPVVPSWEAKPHRHGRQSMAYIKDRSTFPIVSEYSAPYDF